MASRRLKCLFRRHRWHTNWDAEKHKTVRRCTRCGVVKAALNLEGMGGAGYGSG